MILSKFLSVTKVDKDWLARAYLFLATNKQAFHGDHRRWLFSPPTSLARLLVVGCGRH